MRPLPLFAVLAVAAIVPPCAPAATGLCGLDRQYLTTEVRGNLFEIAGGRIAQQRASTPGVKNLGAVLVRDHSKSLTESGTLARRLGLKVPGNLDPVQHWQLHVAGTYSGRQFDQLYAWLEVADHTVDIENATEEASNGCQPQVRALARKSLPLLRQHLKLATQAQAAAKA
jgi:putative membrane protein